MQPANFLNDILFGFQVCPPKRHLQADIAKLVLWAMTVDFNVIEQSADVVLGKVRAKPLINKSTRYVYGCRLVFPCKILIKNPTMFTRK